jgi:hypothetical protein
MLWSRIKGSLFLSLFAGSVWGLYKESIIAGLIYGGLCFVLGVILENTIFKSRKST